MNKLSTLPVQKKPVKYQTEGLVSYENNQPKFKRTEGAAVNRKRGSRKLRFFNLLISYYRKQICFSVISALLVLSYYWYGMEGVVGTVAVILTNFALLCLVFLAAVLKDIVLDTRDNVVHLWEKSGRH